MQLKISFELDAHQSQLFTDRLRAIVEDKKQQSMGQRLKKTDVEERESSMTYSSPVVDRSTARILHSKSPIQTL